MAEVAFSAESGSGEDGVRRAVLRNELRSELPANILGGALIVAVISYLGIAFWDTANRPALIAWLAFFAAVMARWAITSTRKLWQVARGEGLKPGRAVEEEPELAARRACVMMTFCNIGIAVSFWILLPAADPAMRAVVLVLALWYLGVQLLGATEASQVAFSAIVMVIGSLTAFVLWERGSHAIELSVILIAFGATMLVLRRFLRGAVTRAAAERARSEQARASLADALGVVAAERDSKTRFLEAASHDLQQPLQAASLYLDQALGEGDPAQRERAAAGVRKALSSTQMLLETMLDHLRMEAGAAPVRLAAVALGPLLRDVALEHDAAAEAAGMRLTVLPSRLTVRADPRLLHRALGNLAANAIRHSCGERVLIGARRRGETAELWVIDDGKGIDEEDRATLFETFARGRHARTAGFGIGLASTRAAAELMGGAIALDPRWTAGSAFRIELPLQVSRPSVEVACEAV